MTDAPRASTDPEHLWKLLQLHASLASLSKKSELAGAIHYALSRW